jgi:hypothetical protein
MGLLLRQLVSKSDSELWLRPLQKPINCGSKLNKYHSLQAMSNTLVSPPRYKRLREPNEDSISVISGSLWC